MLGVFIIVSSVGFVLFFIYSVITKKNDTLFMLPFVIAILLLGYFVVYPAYDEYVDKKKTRAAVELKK